MQYELKLINHVVKAEKSHIDFIIPKFVSDWLIIDGGSIEVWELITKIFQANNIDLQYHKIEGIKRVIDNCTQLGTFKGRIYYS